jgi:hypothetical protein
MATYDVSNSYLVAVASCGRPETRDKPFMSQYTQIGTGRLCEAWSLGSAERQLGIKAVTPGYCVLDTRERRQQVQQSRCWR